MSVHAAFAIGLPAFTLNKVFSPGFFAREDTRTPMIFAIISVIVNVAGSLTLSHFIGPAGIALATALAAWVNSTLLALTFFVMTYPLTLLGRWLERRYARQPRPAAASRAPVSQAALETENA